MGNIEIHAGDFRPGKSSRYQGPRFLERNGKLLFDTGRGSFFQEKVEVSEIADIEKASTESVTRIGGAIGWGIAGDAILGPVGLLAGLLVGSRGTNVDFVCKLKDGRKFIGTTSHSVFSKLRAAAARNQWDTTHPTKIEIERPKSRITAGVLAIFLGSFGVHRFYLGQWWGILYLAFCFTLIPAALGVIEGCYFLLRTDREWKEKYGG